MYFLTTGIKPNTVSIRNSGELLTGRLYSHLKFARNTYEFVISADEFTQNDGLDTDRFEFLKAFWLAPFIYLALMPVSGSYWVDTDVPDYIQLQPVGGAFPLSYLEEIELLKEVSFQFEAVEVI